VVDFSCGGGILSYLQPFGGEGKEGRGRKEGAVSTNLECCFSFFFSLQEEKERKEREREEKVTSA